MHCVHRLGRPHIEEAKVRLRTLWLLNLHDQDSISSPLHCQARIQALLAQDLQLQCNHEYHIT